MDLSILLDYIIHSQVSCDGVSILDQSNFRFRLIGLRLVGADV